MSDPDADTQPLPVVEEGPPWLVNRDDEQLEVLVPENLRGWFRRRLSPDKK